jgi:hypothetical protein
VFARHNAVDTPALLPDGTIAERSVSATLKSRGEILDADELVAPVRRTLRAIAGDDDDPSARDPYAGTQIGMGRLGPGRSSPDLPDRTRSTTAGEEER